MHLYRVARRGGLVTFVADALERSGCRINRMPDPTRAPFIFNVRAPWGDTLDLICYAFLANKYLQKGRPPDEHRFQVKYGSEFHRFHDIYLPQGPNEVTLMFGVHLEEGVVVAVDPAMHNPTWFSRSVEFKTAHVEEIQETSWYGWERERLWARRRQLPLENFQTEVLLGLVPERFADYIRLELQTTGVSPGERLLLIERGGVRIDEGHPLEMELGLSMKEILDMIGGGARRLLVAVRGRAAEMHLRRLLVSTPAIDSVSGVDEDGKPDFIVSYRGRALRIECKNTLRHLRQGKPKVDFQKTRASKADPCSRYYRPDQFEVLAACLHPVTERWEFKFRPTEALAAHPKCSGHLSQHVLVNGDWFDAVTDVLDAVTT